MKKKIVLIVSNGKSGSTVLDKALGSHKDAFSIGALSHLDITLEENTLCSCGVEMESCSFWTEIMETYRAENPTQNNKIRTILTPIKGKGVKGIFSFFKDILLLNKGKEVEKTLKDTRKIYELVFQKTGKEVLIDSSKNLRRALMLKKHLKDYEVHLLHLVRDGRAVLNSYQKKIYFVETTLANDGQAVKEEFKRKVFPPEQIINGWKAFNLRTLCFLKFHKDKEFIRYEDFSARPIEELTRVYKSFGISFNGPEGLDLTQVDYHMVGGNASRLNAKKINQSEEKWRKTLPEEVIEQFNSKAGWLSKYFGYK